MSTYDRGHGNLPCAGCRQEDAPGLGERFSFGCYAGVYCDPCWPKSGYRDATDESAVFDPADAGEVIDDPDGYMFGDDF